MKRKAGITIWMILVGLFLSIAGCGGADSGGNNTGGSYSITGKISDSTGAGLAVVTVALSGTSTASVPTDSAGNYTFTGLANGTYAIAPSKSGSTFAPLSKAVSVNNANLPGQDFAGTVASGSTYAISGKVSDSSSAGISGVTMTISGANTGSTVTDSSGNYSFAGTSSGSYTVTPAKSGNTFNPSSRAVTISSANSIGQDFAGSSTGGGGNTTSANYYPVAVGNKWTYSIAGTGASAGLTTTSEVTQTGNNTFTMKASQSNTTDYSTMDYVFANNTWAFSKVNSCGANGTVYTVTTYAPPMPILPSNTSLGTQETYTTSATSVSSAGQSSFTMSNTFTIVGSETVTVPAGTFNNALKVTNTNTFNTTMWFANGVGFIKSISTWSTGSQTVELTSYTIH